MHRYVPRRPTASTLVVWLAASALCLTTLACGSSEPPRPADRYQSRGIVRQLPAKTAPRPEVYIHHEAIGEFKDRDGQVVGMEPMAMPFPVDDMAVLDRFAVGDKVEFTFEVNWHTGHPLRLIALNPLPIDTRLEFETTP